MFIFLWNICHFLINICCICTITRDDRFSSISAVILLSRCDNTLCSIFAAFLLTTVDKANRAVYLPQFCCHVVTTTLCSIFAAFLLPVSDVIYHDVFLLHFCCLNVRVDMPDFLLHFYNIFCWRSFTVFFVDALCQHRMLQFCSFYEDKFCSIFIAFFWYAMTQSLLDIFYIFADTICYNILCSNTARTLPTQYVA